MGFTLIAREQLPFTNIDVLYDCNVFKKVLTGQIHVSHLRIRKDFTDDSSVNFHDKVFLQFVKKFGKK